MTLSATRAQRQFRRSPVVATVVATLVLLGWLLLTIEDSAGWFR